MASDSPTLLWLLDVAQKYHQHQARSPVEPATEKWYHADLAAQLRAAHTRLREEMERAAKRLGDRDLTRAMRYQAATDMDCLERINGGPIEKGGGK